MVIKTAERRMFAKTIIDSDAFLDMPLSTQALYFHLSMRADDDGFINNPKKTQRMIGCSDDDLKLLIAKNFIIPFENGVVVIKHWKIHNYIQKDRYKPTNYQEEKSLLTTKDNGSYTLDTECIHDGYSLETQVRLGKVRLGEDSIGKANKSISNDILSCPTESDSGKGNTSFDLVISSWNALSQYGVVPIKKINEGTNRATMLRARIREYGIDDVCKAIDNIHRSDFLKGKNDKGWIVVFDWFIKPNNFSKVLEGNYNNRDKGKVEEEPKPKSRWQ